MLWTASELSTNFIQVHNLVSNEHEAHNTPIHRRHSSVTKECNRAVIII
jgi:hypothetical protein